MREGVNRGLEVLRSILITAALHLLLRQIEVGQRVGFLIADHVVVGGNGLRRGVGPTVTGGHLLTQLTPLGLLLGRRLGVGLLVLCGGVIVFPEGIEFVSLLQCLICTTTRQECGEDDDGAYHIKTSHTL